MIEKFASAFALRKWLDQLLTQVADPPCSAIGTSPVHLNPGPFPPTERHSGNHIFRFLFSKMAVDLGEEGFASCGCDGLVVLWKVIDTFLSPPTLAL